MTLQLLSEVNPKTGIVLVLIPIIFVVAIVLAVIIPPAKKRNKNNHYHNTYIPQQPKNQQQLNGFDSQPIVTEPNDLKQNEVFPYIFNRSIFTHKEYSFYKSLKPITDALNLNILSKVRIADLVTTPKNIPDYIRWFNYIKAKHIDFVICDENMNIMFLIEVDDYTHQYENRKSRDQFVDKIFAQLGVDLLHIYKWTQEELQAKIQQEVNKLRGNTAAEPTFVQ